MSAPLDLDLVVRLHLAEKRWLDQCACRLREARARERAERRTPPLPDARARRVRGTAR